MCSDRDRDLLSTMLTLTRGYLGLLLLSGTVHASTNLTSLVNLFIGTASGANGGSGGNAFPGAAVPHAMVKVCLSICFLT